MASFFESLRLGLKPRGQRDEVVARKPTSHGVRGGESPPVEIAPNDPLIPYFLSAPGAVEIDKIHLDSPALTQLRAAGVRLVVPLVSQGELVGLLNLGPRLSEQDYSTYDRGLLNDLATQAAPALRVAQLVREQQMEIRARERLEQELRVARLIQQTLLPKELPDIAGWEFAAYYQAARAVGGDFYDFLAFPDGRLGIVIGDVTDKGVPAALVMATTRSILRAAAQENTSPGAVLERANNLLCPDIPAKMFVTCFYGLLDPTSGRLVFANAGHDLPYRRHDDGAEELQARGMPLGLMPGMAYEENALILAAGDSILFHSDGLVEAHSPTGEMFGFPRLAAFVASHEGGKMLIDALLDQLGEFTGPGWEQEDDVTFVTLRRASLNSAADAAPGASRSASLAAPIALAEPAPDTPEAPEAPNAPNAPETAAPVADEDWSTLATFSLPSEPGNERDAMDQVAEVLRPLGLTPKQLEHLKTAVAEATMNAMEHGNGYTAELPVYIEVLRSDRAVMVRIRDQGGNRPIPTPQTPDLEAKLAERQTPRGWGLFLIQNLVDEMRVTSDETHHTIELIMRLEGGPRDGEAS